MTVAYWLIDLDFIYLLNLYSFICIQSGRHWAVLRLIYLQPCSFLLTNVNIKLMRAVSPQISSQFTLVGNIHVRNVITRLHLRTVSPNINNPSTWVRNSHVRNVITLLHIRAISPHISSQSTWVRNIHVRVVITRLHIIRWYILLDWPTAD